MDFLERNFIYQQLHCADGTIRSMATTQTSVAPTKT
jgi:hypothetical protein